MGRIMKQEAVIARVPVLFSVLALIPLAIANDTDQPVDHRGSRLRHRLLSECDQDGELCNVIPYFIFVFGGLLLLVIAVYGCYEAYQRGCSAASSAARSQSPTPLVIELTDPDQVTILDPSSGRQVPPVNEDDTIPVVEGDAVYSITFVRPEA
jgi:hypothetical protein